MFLDRIKTALKITNFRIQSRITLFELLIDLTLRLKLMIDIPDTKPPSLAQPQGIL